MKKLLSILFLATFLSTAAHADIITLGFHAGTPDKFVNIPSGKVCKVVTFRATTAVLFILLDDGTTYAQVFSADSADANRTIPQELVIAGPNKLKIDPGSDGLISLEIKDQTTPTFGVTFEDN